MAKKNSGKTVATNNVLVLAEFALPSTPVTVTTPPEFRVSFRETFADNYTPGVPYLTGYSVVLENPPQTTTKLVPNLRHVVRLFTAGELAGNAAAFMVRLADSGHQNIRAIDELTREVLKDKLTKAETTKLRKSHNIPAPDVVEKVKKPRTPRKAAQRKAA